VGYQVRVLDNNELKTFYGNTISEDILESMAAKFSLPGVKVDENFSFPKKTERCEFAWSDELEKIPISQKWELLELLTERTYEQNFFVKQIRYAEYKESIEKIFYINSNGVSMSGDMSQLMLSVESIGKKGEKISSGWGSSLSTKWEELDIDHCAELSAELARVQLFQENIKPGKYHILFRPYPASFLLFMIWQMILDEDEERINFSKGLDVSNNPINNSWVGSRPFSPDGKLNEILPIIKDGKPILNKEKKCHFGRRLFAVSGRRTCLASNIYIEPKDVMLSMPDGDFIEVFAMQLLPTSSENGKILEFHISGVIHRKNESLPFAYAKLGIETDGFPGKIKSIGYDLKFYSMGDGNIYGAPSIVCDGLSIIE
jgi:predicted Zn-dependent protease